MRKFFVCFCAAVVCLGASIVSAADIRQGLVAYWQMDGTDGVIIPDATPFGNNLNVVNVTGGNFVAGQFGNALSLNGSSTYATNLHSTDPSISGLPIYRAGRYTITMWVKGAAQTAKYLYSEAFTNAPGSPPVTTPQNPLFILQTGQSAANNAKFDVIIRDDAGGTRVNHVVSTNIVFDNNWHHIAWVDDAGSVKLYIDGNLDPANFSYTPSGTFTMNTTAIGTLVRAAVATGSIFNGLIDDVGVWRRALSAAEVQQVRTNSLVTPIPAFPPTFTTQPVGSTNHVGDRVTFSAVVDGNPPIALQWLKDNVEIPGAINTTLSLSNLVFGQSGDYVLRATNRFGTNFSSAATLSVIPDPAPDLRGRIVSYWSMDDELDDGTGQGVIYDSYGSNNLKAVVLGGFIDLAPGIFNNAAQFNGFDQYLIRDGGYPIYNNPAYSVAFWINASASQSDRVILAESFTNNTTSTFAFGTQTNGAGKLRVLIRNSAGAVLLDRASTRTILDDTWHHVVWSESNGEVRLYIDGVLDETSFNYSRSFLPFNATTVGALLSANGASNYFNGTLDELSTWSRAISYTEVQQLRTNTVPVPLSPTAAPAITANPVGRSLLTRAGVTFNFAASGTAPLLQQWRKNGTNLPGATSPLLTLPHVTLNDAGDYDVVVTNPYGSATSQVATLTVTLRPPTPTDLKIDFNNLGVDNTPANTETNFSPFVLDVAAGPGPVVRSFGGAEVTLATVGGINMESRRRTVPSNSVDFTQEKLLLDFVFARDAVLGQGLDISVAYLDPLQTYNVTIWSFDSVSTPNRVSDWSANGVVLTNGYSFNGTVNLPTNNAQYRFTYPVTADADGTILIQGRRDTNATVGINVFINALEVALVTNPPAAIHIDNVALTSTNTLHLSISGITPANTRRIQQITNVTDTVWTDVSGAVFGTPNANSVDVIIPVPDTATRFYRVVETPVP